MQLLVLLLLVLMLVLMLLVLLLLVLLLLVLLLLTRPSSLSLSTGRWHGWRRCRCGR